MALGTFKCSERDATAAYRRTESAPMNGKVRESPFQRRSVEKVWLVERRGEKGRRREWRRIAAKCNLIKIL